MRRTLYLAAASVLLAQGGAAVAGEGGAEPAFLPMTDIVVPIVDGSRAHGRLRVRIVIMARDAAAIASLQTQMPELRETALVAAAEFARLHASPFAPVDAKRLSNDLSAAFKARDPEHFIARILLVGVSAARS